MADLISIDLFGIYISQLEFDILLIFTLAISAVIRGIFAWKEESDHIIRYTVIWISFWILILYEAAWGSQLQPKMLWGLLALVPMFIFYYRGPIRLAALSVPVLALLIVGVLAAVNAGLRE